MTTRERGFSVPMVSPLCTPLDGFDANMPTSLLSNQGQIVMDSSLTALYFTVDMYVQLLINMIYELLWVAASLL